MKNTKDLKEWVFIAKSDLDSASYLSHMKPFPTAIICYHSQQCVEKLLKGFLALNGRPVRAAEWLCYRHSLSVFRSPYCSRWVNGYTTCSKSNAFLQKDLKQTKYKWNRNWLKIEEIHKRKCLLNRDSLFLSKKRGGMLHSSMKWYFTMELTI